MEKIEKWVEKGNISKLDKILAKGSPEERKELYDALRNTHNEDIINLLVTNLRSPDMEVKKASVVALGHSGAHRTTEFLRKITRDYPDSEIAELAKESIRMLT